jgi:hypothetical protein
MKNFVSILILCLLWFNNIKAQEFYPNKELDIEKLINFDLNKYKFSEYKDIIGNNIKSWNGDPEQLSKNVKNWKAIDIKINNEEYELRLNHFKTGEIGFFILIRGLSCETAKSIIPKKYIKKENSLAYTSDWDEFGKLYLEKFSYDTNKNTRLFSGCIAMLDKSNIGSVEDVSFTINLYSQNSPNNPPIVPLKMIRCEVLQYKNKYKLDSNNLREMNYTFKDMPQKVTMDFYISDSDGELLNTKFRDVGNRIVRFDRDLIHIEQIYKLDKTKVERLFTYEEYKIDRINGDYYFNKREYDKNYITALTPNNELEMQYKGKCVKKDINERAF